MELRENFVQFMIFILKMWLHFFERCIKQVTFIYHQKFLKNNNICKYLSRNILKLRNKILSEIVCQQQQCNATCDVIILVKQKISCICEITFVIYFLHSCNISENFKVISSVVSLNNLFWKLIWKCKKRVLFPFTFSITKLYS